MEGVALLDESSDNRIDLSLIVVGWKPLMPLIATDAMSCVKSCIGLNFSVVFILWSFCMEDLALFESRDGYQ